MNFAADVEAELRAARNKHPNQFNSLHEGYAILLEEVDEYKDHVWGRTSGLLPDIYQELVQVAAMAQRNAEDVLRDRKGFQA